MRDSFTNLSWEVWRYALTQAIDVEQLTLNIDVERFQAGQLDL